MGIQINGQTDTISAVDGSFNLAGTVVANSGTVTVGTGATIHSPTTNVLTLGTNNSERLRITSTGLVGIGTDNPAVNLEVRNTSPTFRVTGNSATNPTIALSSATITTWSQTVSGTDSSLFISRDGTERLRINSSGYVGIGTNNPSKPLQVHSDSSSAVLITGATPQLRLNSNVGDGTDADRVILGRASGNDQFIAGSVDGDAILRCATSKKVMIGYGTTEIAQFNSSGLKFKVSGMGIDFSATSDAGGMTSELLDDYEEGTWTPNLDNAYVTTPGTTYNSRAGKYVKIGRMVLARFFMNIAGVTNSGVGPFFFGGLPFTHDTDDISHRGLQASLYISGPNTPAGAVNVNLGYATLDNGNYYLTLSTPIDDAASNNSRVIQASDISNGDVISGTIMYISE